MAANGATVSDGCYDYEDAMNKTGFGRFTIRTILFCGLLLIGMIFESLGFGYVIPASQCDLELSTFDKGLLASVPFVCMVVMSHSWGYLADTRGRKNVLRLAMGVGSFFSILSSFSPDFTTFVACRVLAGIFIAAGAALGYTYLGEMSPLKYRDSMIIMGNASITLGTGVVPLIAWAVLPLDWGAGATLGFLPHGYRSWRLLVALFALPYALCAALFAWFPESPKYLHGRGDADATLRVLRRMHAINNPGAGAKPYPVMSIRPSATGRAADGERSFLSSVWHQTVPLFGRAYIKHTLLAFFLQFVILAVTNGYYIWYPEVVNRILVSGDERRRNLCAIFNDDGGTPDESRRECDDSLQTGAFFYMSVLGLAVFVATAVAALLRGAVGKRGLLGAWLCGVGACALAIHWAEDTTWALLLFSGLQFCAICIGIVNAFVVQIFPTHIRAMAMCMTMMVGRMGSVFGTNLIRYLITTECTLSFFVFAALLFASALLCFFLPADPPSRKSSALSSVVAERRTSKRSTRGAPESRL